MVADDYKLRVSKSRDEKTQGSERATEEMYEHPTTACQRYIAGYAYILETAELYTVSRSLEPKGQKAVQNMATGVPIS